MINVSQTIKNSCKADTNTHTEYIIINGQTIYIKGKLNATAYKDTTFFGTFNMKVLEFETENTTQFRNREFEYYKVIDGNAFKVGTFITTEVVDNDSKDTIKVTANDYALKFAVPYTSELDYGSGEITLYDVLEECCNQVGVELENKFIDNNSFKVDSNQFVNGELVGDVICAIAGISGNFATITNEDKLRLTFTNGTGAEQTTTIDGSTQINASGFKDIELLAKTTQETTTGKNLLKNDLATRTESGITITKNSDGTYKVNGTATADISLAINNDFVSMSGTWRMLGCPSGGSSTTYMLSAYVGYWGGGSPNIDTGSGTNITYTGNVKVRFYIKSGTTCNNLIFKPMLTTDTSATINDWEPYTNGASPNPNFPQPIETTTGRNTIDVIGKNIFNFDDFLTQRGATYTNNNGVYSITTWKGGLYNNPYTLNLTAGQTYTFSQLYQTQTSTNVRFEILKNGTIYTSSYATSQDSLTRTFTADSSVYTIRLNYTSKTDPIIINKPMIEKSSTATTYEPYIGNSYEVNLGKNLLPNTATTTTINGITFTANVDGTILVSGTASATAYLTYPTFSLNAGTYTLNAGVYVNTLTRIQLVEDTSGRPLLASTQNASSQTFTTTATKNVFLQFRVNSGEVINTTFYPQLEKGATASSYSPYFEPIELCKIGTYQDRLFKSSGKNLIGLPNDWTYNSSGIRATVNNDKIIISGTSTAVSLIDIPLLQTIPSSLGTMIKSLRPTGTYTGVQTSLRQQVANTSAGVWSNDGATTSGTLSGDAYWFRIQVNSGITINCTLQPQIETGSVVSNYEPYGNYWYKYKAIGKVVLNGTENWLSQTQTGFYRYGLTIDEINNNSSLANQILIISNQFRGITFNSRANDINETIYVVNNGQQHQFFVNTKLFNTIANFKTHLNSNNLVNYYVLATPTYERITNEELIGQLERLKTLHLFDGINNITTNAPYFLTYLDGNVEVLEDYTDLDDKRDTQPITSVSIGTSQVEGQEAILRDESLIAQYGEHWLVINDNPFGYTLEKRQQLVKAIFDKVKGFGYSSFKSEYSYRPYLELGDKIKFRNKNGDLINSAILRYDFDFDNCTFEAPSITSATINYELSPDANELAKRAEIIANQAETSITSITQELQIDEDGNSQVIESIKTTQTQNSLDIEAITSYQEIDGERVLTGVKTGKGFTFNNSGLIIQSTDNTYKAVHNEIGDYYYDGDTPLGETTNEGSKFKNMDLYGEFRYGKDDIDDNALFVSMKYEDDGEECFGHFWNGD